MLEAILEVAKQLSQGGIILVLVFLLLALLYACKVLFESYKEITLRAIAAIEAQTVAIETQTRAIEANARSSDANRAAIDGVKEVLDIFTRMR